MNTIMLAFLHYLQVEKNYSDLTIVRYRWALSQFEDFVSSSTGSFDPLRPNLNQVRAWMADMGRRNLSVATIKHGLCVLRSFYKFLRLKKYIDTNPLALLTSPRVPRPLPVWVSEEQMDHLLDDVDFGSDFCGLRDRLLVDLLYSTGMRRSEAARLKDGDIDFGRRTIRVFGKGRKERLIPFGQELEDLMRNYMALRMEVTGIRAEYFLTDEEGDALKPNDVTKIAHKALDHLPHLAKKGAHVLRHSFATSMLSNGADLMAVKELLGHASLQSTEVYTHVTPQEILDNYRTAHPRASEAEKKEK